jgi:hypothetical protein
MNVSAVTGVAASFEGARVAGQQTAVTAASVSQTKNDDDRHAQDTDLKKTDTVTQDQGSSGSSETNGHRVNIIA